MSNSRGKFITVEGIDCAGKTTNVPLLADHLRARGYKVITTREPGGNPIGDKIREILLDASLSKMDPVTELMLFLAARNEHVKKVVIPHLEKGYVVICDRFHDSTYAYQGFGRGLLGHLQRLKGYVNADIIPDHTLFFNLPLEEALRRLALRAGKQDRLDMEEEDFRRKVYEGFQSRFHLVEHGTLTQSNRKIHRIDALPEPEQVSQQVIAWANANFENLN